MKKLKINARSVFAVLFGAIILFFFITIGERFVRSSILHQDISGIFKNETDYSETAQSGTDWSKVYPFREENAQEKEEQPIEPIEPEKTEESKNPLKKFSDLVKTYEGGVDYFTNKLLFLRMNLIELNGKFSKAVGMKLVTGEDNVIFLADGNLSYYPTMPDVSQSIVNIENFSEYVKSKGGKFLYVQTPSKVDPDNNYLPAGVEDGDNITADKVVNALSDYGIKCLDLRKSMKEQGMSFTESFYRTDHHWKTGMGLWAANEISKTLSEKGFDYKPELLSPSQYEEKVYKDYMFGSLGMQVTLAYADPEDISVYLPKFETNFKADYYDFGFKEGSFRDSLMNMSLLDKIDYYNVSTYASYLYGVSPIASVENLLADNDTRVLFISDSFCHCVIPYVATQVKYIDKLDLRYFNGSVETFIDETKPDIVIVMYYPGTLSNGNDRTMIFK